MNLIKKIDSNIYITVLGSMTLILLVFAVIVQAIGYFGFTSSFEREYEDSVYKTARLCVDALGYNDFKDYNKYSMEEMREVYALGDYKAYQEYCTENAIEGDELYYVANSYFSIKEYISQVCNTMGMSVIYIIVPSDDYETYTSIFNCLNDDSPYEEWELGHVEKTSAEDYKEAYRNIMEGKSQAQIVERYNDLGDGIPHITALTPVREAESGEVIGILCVQRYTQELTRVRKNFVQGVGAIGVIFVILLILFESRYLRKRIINPILDISKEAERFAKENVRKTDVLDKDSYAVSEIKNLVNAVDKMEGDTLNNIDNIKSIVGEQERLSADLSLASKIQIGMLPLKHQLLKERDEFDVHATMTAAKEVGGDFYDFYMIDDKHLVIEIADVSDKGLGAAFFMAIAKTLIKSRAGLGGTAAEIIAYVDKMVAEKNVAGMFVTVWFAIIDLETGHTNICNAGHDYPAIMKDGNDYVINKTPHGPPVAFLPEPKFVDYEIDLSPGDRIFLYTDGLNEAKRSDGQRFGLERLLKVLNAHKNDTNEVLIAAMTDSVKAFTGSEPQFDDMTMLSFTFNKKI
ncbi:MAG: PP2C family protein-serine/threonine phosphatase [Eubacterium sp.]|nr:PP2C family protein-serine/threonine phosphatase [Eubacterium sp.]